ncbi:DUF4198 domain-containing protein [Shewanella algae]|uniref:DUF4198 domain-containing protein n=1 Tax=Shewanella algae TaxID=38313 RepID=UPI001FBBE146|nr:DUF4198 domain-containing protein [Shewanella algae]
MMKTSKLLLALGACLLAQTAQAHDRFILPSQFNVSADPGKGVWITSDVSASNEVFLFDKPFGSEDVQIITPSGTKERPSSSYRGSRKSVFDYRLTEDGTYRFEKETQPRYMSRYKLKGQQDSIRSRTDKQTTKAMMPKGAYDLEGALYFSRVESYVTLNKPSDKAFEVKGEYLELKPLTHPADIVEQEPTELQFYFQGKVIAGVEVAIVKEGTLYRNQKQELTLTSDKEGKVSFELPSAGRYMLHASFEQPNADTRLADKTVSEIFLTFEAGLQ